MLKQIKYFIFMPLMLLLTACAFQSESIALKPQVNVSATQIGMGKSIAVEVVDVRNDTSLGGRASGYGPAANISLADDIVKVVKTEVSQGLMKKGFKVVADENNPRKLIVRIVGLQYQQRTGFWAISIIVTSSLEAVAQNNGKNYQQMYRSRVEHQVLVTPTSGADTGYVNAAISDLLNKLLNDEQLLIFLAK